MAAFPDPGSVPGLVAALPTPAAAAAVAVVVVVGEPAVEEELAEVGPVAAEPAGPAAAAAAAGTQRYFNLAAWSLYDMNGNTRVTYS